MEALGPKPKGKFTAHHDFIWAEKKWFACHGIDVNDPAYGRWMKKEEHRGWHGWRGGEFNAWWNEWIAQEPEIGYTMQEIFQKLVECRQQFPDTP